MMRYVLLLAGMMAVAAAGCGEAPDAQIAPVVRMDGILQDEVDTLSFYVVASQQTDGIVVTCNSIGLSVMPGDPVLEEFSRLEIAFSAGDARTLELSGVPKSRAVIVYAEARLGPSLVARACAEDVVAGGSPLNLTFFRI